MNRFLRYRLLELFKAIVFLALGSYLGALYATHELRPTDRSVLSRAHQRSNAFLTVFVVSAPDNKEKRDVLRRTWLSVCAPPECIFRFVIGTAQLSGNVIPDLTSADMLQLPKLKDSYHALTQKVGLSLAWIDENIDTEFVLKADEDTFVNLPKLLEVLKQYGPDLYMGYFSGRARVKKTGPWAEPKWNICDYYLPNARGGGYVLGRNAVSFIARNIDSLTIWNNEDVSVGGWLGPLPLNRVHMVEFDTEASSRGCSNRYIVTHKQDPEMITEKWKNLQRDGKICSEEFQKKSGYVYDWNVPPSQCCNPDKNIP